MSYQDTLTQGILDGNLFAGKVTVRTPADVNKASWGIYNPLNSGVKALLYYLNITVNNLQPIQDTSASASLGFGYMVYVSNQSTTAINKVTAPTVTTANSFNNTLNSAVFSPLLTLGDANYGTPSPLNTPLNIHQDLQPGVTFSLEDYVDIQNTYPLILAPGDFLGGAMGINFSSSALGGVNNIKVAFIQLPA